MQFGVGISATLGCLHGHTAQAELFVAGGLDSLAERCDVAPPGFVDFVFVVGGRGGVAHSTLAVSALPTIAAVISFTRIPGSFDVATRPVSSAAVELNARR